MLYDRHRLVPGLRAAGDDVADWRGSLCSVLAEDPSWGLKYLLAWNALPDNLRKVPLLTETDMEELRMRMPEKDRANLRERPGAMCDLLMAGSAAMDPLIRTLKKNLAGLTPLRTVRGE